MSEVPLYPLSLSPVFFPSPTWNKAREERHTGFLPPYTLHPKPYTLNPTP